MCRRKELTGQNKFIQEKEALIKISYMRFKAKNIIRIGAAGTLFMFAVSCASHQPDAHRTLIWSDEFNGKGLPDSSKWNYDVGGGGFGNEEAQFYTKNRLENARMEKGNLVIEARKENWESNKYTSARLLTKGKFFSIRNC
jgi:beta-glucanase (GH16 family)